MNDEPPDLNDLETLQHLCRVRDNAWCERPFDSYITRLSGRQERGEPLTELQLLILDAVNLRRCYENEKNMGAYFKENLLALMGVCTPAQQGEALEKIKAAKAEQPTETPCTKSQSPS